MANDIDRQLRLFDSPSRPRAVPRKLMHVFDAGVGTEGRDRVRLRCLRCGYQSPWMQMLTSDATRGVPCPECNGKPPVAPLDRDEGDR